MRILWIKTDLLHPVDKGGKIRTYEMLRAIRREHEVVYLCLDDGTAPENAADLAMEYCTELVRVPFHSVEKRGPQFLADLASNLFSRLPYVCWKYRSLEMERRVTQLAATADLVVCDFLFPTVNVPPAIKPKAVLFQHNVEAQIWRRRVDVAGPAVRPYLAMQWRRVRDVEASACREFGHVVAVSAADAEQLRRDYGVPSVSYVATGVDVEAFRRPTGERNPREVVFVGSMDWMPNEDGMRWFVAEVWPRVLATEPHASLSIVGRRPSESLREAAARAPNVSVTGTVKDVRPFLWRSAASVVPLRVGGGTRLKIFESMAAGSPVVSTAIGAEGLPVRPGREFLLADDPEEFAARIVEVLRDEDLAERLRRSALEFVERNASWRTVARDFLRQCAIAPVRPNAVRTGTLG